ncbi:outer membrane lipoprotein carrier protein LolA [Methylophaga sp.]|uniref:outer membrane lipoprotein carrier protein LolA n=1 Tax=Methylophaga sp. TaxID=2024840 RepID=UPI003A9389F7
MIRLSMLMMLFISFSAQAELSYDLLAKLTDSPASLQGRFEQQKQIVEFDTTLTSQGRFEYQRHQFIHWMTETPIENELTMTPDDIVSRQGNNEILHIKTDKNPSVQILSNIFFAVLTAQWHDLAEFFYANGEQHGEQWHVTLTPKKQTLKQVVSSVELSGDKWLREVTLNEHNGDKTHITFSELSQSR